MFEIKSIMIYTLGETLLDVIIDPKGKTVARPGGAMLNVAVSLARAGNNVSLISETGNDHTGRYIVDFLTDNRVHTGFINSYENEKSSLALAFLDKNKKPAYTFFKNYPEIRKLKLPDVFNKNDLLLFGSLYALDSKINEQISTTVRRVSSSGGLIIYDPNIRKNNSGIDMKKVYEYFSLAHIIKGSDEDFENIFGVSNLKTVAGIIREINSDALLIITQGSGGAIAFLNEMITEVPAPVINPVSTVGAGDGFSAGLIHFIKKKKISTAAVSSLHLSGLRNLLGSGIGFATKVCLSEENYIGQEARV